MAKKPPFEKSKKDVEPKGMKEGSKREEAYDRMQAKRGYADGGLVGKPEGGGKVRGTGAARKGTKFTGVF